MEQSEVMKLLEKKIKIDKKIKSLYGQISELTEQIKDNCKHPDMEEQHSWFSGGYDYQGEDRSWLECPVCGHKQDLKVRYTGFA